VSDAPHRNKEGGKCKNDKRKEKPNRYVLNDLVVQGGGGGVRERELKVSWSKKASQREKRVLGRPGLGKGISVAGEDDAPKERSGDKAQERVLSPSLGDGDDPR